MFYFNLLPHRWYNGYRVGLE